MRTQEKELGVMLVDDEAMILQGLRRLFDWEAHGCVILGEAMDGASAVSMADRLKPDLIFMDVNLPIINGLDAVRIIRQRHPQIQCIILTGYDSFEYCRKALRLQALDYILKPVDFRALSDIVKKAADAIKSRLPLSGEARRMTGEDHEEVRPILRMISWLHAHLEEDVSLKRLSEIFHLNDTYISQLFKSELGVNYHMYLNQIRIDKAKELLLTTEKSIAEIAGLTGYKDYRTFTRAFRSTAGILPSALRREGRLVGRDAHQTCIRSEK